MEGGQIENVSKNERRFIKGKEEGQSRNSKVGPEKQNQGNE